jgi:hypothetical protein
MIPIAGQSIWPDSPKSLPGEILAYYYNKTWFKRPEQRWWQRGSTRSRTASRTSRLASQVSNLTQSKDDLCRNLFIWMFSACAVCSASKLIYFNNIWFWWNNVSLSWSSKGLFYCLILSGPPTVFFLLFMSRLVFYWNQRLANLSTLVNVSLVTGLKHVSKLI